MLLFKETKALNLFLTAQWQLKREGKGPCELAYLMVMCLLSLSILRSLMFFVSLLS